MGILKDILQFVTVAILGMKDSGKVFTEYVEMGERYLRWGQERNDARDYLAALQNAEKALDENAPKKELLVRKYTVLIESMVGLIRLSTFHYKEALQTVSNRRQASKDEIEATKNSLEGAKALVEKMKANGSMIKAQEELRHVEEIERHLMRIQEKQGDENFLGELEKSFRKAQEEVSHHRSKLEMTFVTMKQSEDVSQEMLNNLIENGKVQLNSAMDEFAQLGTPAENLSGGAFSAGSE